MQSTSLTAKYLVPLRQSDLTFSAKLNCPSGKIVVEMLACEVHNILHEIYSNRRPCRTGPAHGNFELGGVGTSEYKTWSSIKTRCFNQKHGRYVDYGGRGITMCQRWREDFPAFLEDVGPKPEKFTLTRLDRDGHYSCGKCAECVFKVWPANCRWASKAEQNQSGGLLSGQASWTMPRYETFERGFRMEACIEKLPFSTTSGFPLWGK